MRPRRLPRKQPSIEVLGVYSLPVTDDLVREQTDILYGEDLAGTQRRDAERQAREQLESTSTSYGEVSFPEAKEMPDRL